MMSEQCHKSDCSPKISNFSLFLSQTLAQEMTVIGLFYHACCI